MRALEALIYVRTMIDGARSKDEIRREVNFAIDDLYGGIAVDFRDRIARGMH